MTFRFSINFHIHRESIRKSILIRSYFSLMFFLVCFFALFSASQRIELLQSLASMSFSSSLSLCSVFGECIVATRGFSWFPLCHRLFVYGDLLSRKTVKCRSTKATAERINEMIHQTNPCDSLWHGFILIWVDPTRGKENRKNEMKWNLFKRNDDWMPFSMLFSLVLSSSKWDEKRTMKWSTREIELNHAKCYRTRDHFIASFKCYRDVLLISSHISSSLSHLCCLSSFDDVAHDIWSMRSYCDTTEYSIV